MAVGDSDQEVFLGRELGTRRDISEHTSQLVDQEVKRFLDEAHDRARTVIDEQRDLLERIAQSLLDRETLDRDEIALIGKGEELPPLETVEPEGLDAETDAPPVHAPREAKIPLRPLPPDPAVSRSMEDPGH